MERKKSKISIPRSVLKGLNCAAVALLVYAALHCSQLLSAEAFRHAALCSEKSSLTLVEHMCLFLRLSLPISHSLPVCFSRCHIMSLSPTGHVATCRLGSGPCICWGEGDILWAKWTEASENWFYLQFLGLLPESRRFESSVGNPLVDWDSSSREVVLGFFFFLSVSKQCASGDIWVPRNSCRVSTHRFHTALEVVLSTWWRCLRRVKPAADSDQGESKTVAGGGELPGGREDFPDQAPR